MDIRRKKILVVAFVCSFLVVGVFVFNLLYPYEQKYFSKTDYLVEVYLNETTQDDLTAVFYFDNNYTGKTDNSTLNQEFLDYFIQRVEAIRNQVPGIKAFSIYLYINESYLIAEFDPSILNSTSTTRYEVCNKTATLFLEEWYVLDAGVMGVIYN